MTQIASDGVAKNLSESVLLWTWRTLFSVLVLLVAVLAWLVAYGRPYESGSTLGYNLGLAGGLTMVTLLFYSVRKRWKKMDRAGGMPTWFRYHMVAGIAGPALILFHSTFRTGSMNGRVALYSMLLVMTSGIVGRFVYRHVHYGLYGRHISLADAQRDLKDSGAQMQTILAHYPEVEKRLDDFKVDATRPLTNVALRAWRFMTLRLRSRTLGAWVLRSVKQYLRRQAVENQWPRQQLLLNYRLAKRTINGYLGAVVGVSQLATWERLFALWHVVHVPFIYLLVFTGIIHVIAVHMY